MMQTIALLILKPLEFERRITLIQESKKELVEMIEQPNCAPV